MQRREVGEGQKVPGRLQGGGGLREAGKNGRTQKEWVGGWCSLRVSQVSQVLVQDQEEQGWGRGWCSLSVSQ